MKKVLLYSGGMDSWLIDKLWKPDVKLHFDIGTKNNIEENKRMPKDVEIVKLDLARYEDKERNYLLPLRNLFFVEMASYYGDIICLGATGSSTHYDKGEKFARMTEELVNYLYSEAYDKKIKIVMPYANKTKTDMLKEYLQNGGDIQKAWDETFSCYNPDEDGNPCMKCPSCLKRIEAFRNNGYEV